MANPLFKHVSEDLVWQASDLCGKLFDTNCCRKSVIDFEFPNSECQKLFSTKLIGYGIIAGASAIKLPQVFKIFSAKSGAGITLFGVLLELLAITFNTCYSFRNNFPFSAWGEAIFLAVETAAIAFLLLWYDGSKSKAITFLVAYSSMVAALTHPTLVSKNFMWYLQSTVVLLSVSGKLAQALKNYKAQHTGQLSAITVWAIFAGSVVRIFTTIQETGDMLTIVTYACAAAANAAVASQVLYYRKSTRKFIEKKTQ